jgi:hypothetical protein
MLFSIIRWSASEIPNTITSLVSAKVSLNRIADFLYADDLEEYRDNSLMGNDESGKKKNLALHDYLLIYSEVSELFVELG